MAVKKFVVMENMKKTYTMGEVTVSAADGVNLEIEEGEFVVIAGPSGAGKTTILNILGGMDTPTSGKVMVGDLDISGLHGRALADYRRYDIGFVFQFYNLIQNLTALENVELAAQICKNTQDPKAALSDVGLSDRLNSFPSQLSGGEQQRVSIARALAKNPKLLLCDEPTGALDYATGKNILSLLMSACRNKGKTVILITHNLAIAPIADRVLHIKNGKVSKTQTNSSPTPVDCVEW